MFSLDPGANGEKVDTLLEELQRLASLGIQEAHGSVPDVWRLTPLELLGERVVPAAAGF
jgi:alkanesulfonate monooxygenase